MNGAAFNLHLRSPVDRFAVLVSELALGNILPDDMDAFDAVAHRPHVRGFEAGGAVLTVALAVAIKLIEEWQRPLTKGFYAAASSWCDHGGVLDEIPEELRAEVQQVLSKAYARGRTTFENPLERAARLRNSPFGGLRTSAGKMRTQLQSMLPKRFERPYQE